MRKHRAVALCMGLVLALLAFALPPQAVAAADNSVFVHDMAGLLSEAEATYLDDYAWEVGEDHGLSVVVVTTDDTGGLSSMEYASSFFVDNGFGAGAAKSGVLLLINMQDSELYITTHGSAIDVFTDDILDNFIDWLIDDFLVRDNFYGACHGFIEDVDLLMQAAPAQGGGIPSVDTAVSVHDFAGLLTDSQIASLEKSAQAIQKDRRLAAIVVTVSDSGGLPSQQYADDFYDQNGFGHDGLLLLINLGRGDVHISTTGLGNDIFTQQELSGLADEIAEYVSNDNVNQGCALFYGRVDSLAKNYQAGGDVLPTGTGNSSGGGQQGYGWLIGLVAFGLIILAVVVGFLRGNGRRRAARYSTPGYGYGYGSAGYYPGYRLPWYRRMWRPRRPPPPPRHHGGPPPHQQNTSNNRPATPPPTTHTSSGGVQHGGATRSFGRGSSSSAAPSTPPKSTTSTTKSGATFGGGGGSFGSRSSSSGSASRPSGGSTGTSRPSSGSAGASRPSTTRSSSSGGGGFSSSRSSSSSASRPSTSSSRPSSGSSRPSSGSSRPSSGGGGSRGGSKGGKF